jgi:hypothetical protein
MPRKTRTSRILEKAELRASGLKSIDPTLDLGKEMTFANYLEQIQAVRTHLDEHNAALATIDKSRHELDTMEKTLKELTERMLLGVATHYGKDSNEYAMAGGVRTSDRKRPVRAKKLA